MKQWHFLQILSACSIVTPAAAEAQPLVPLAFAPFGLGSIKPQGWLSQQLVLSANGLGGHLMDFWKYVHDSAWLGGDSEYSILHEAFPYWLNAMVPLAYGVTDTRLIAQVRNATDYVLDHQQSDGWLGYETGTNRNVWPRNLLCLALIQIAEADPDYTERVVDSMHRFAVLLNSMLADNYTGFIYHDGDEYSEGATEWGLSRAQDLMIPLQWLFDHYPRNNSQILLDSMQYLYEAGLNWDYWYQADVFPRGELDTLNQTFYNAQPWEYQHGVNMGEGLKACAVYRRFLHDDTLVGLNYQGVNWTFTYHGAASGTILADEYINGIQPYMGSETCTAVETMYSLSYLYQALGNNYYADRAELAAYNALPVSLTPDWWARQYMAEPNQPWSRNLSTTPFSDVNTVGQMYTLEGNYPCCTVNHPQGYPKFLSASYVQVGSGGLAHALLGPANVGAVLKTGANVSVVADTNYPFDLEIVYTVTADAPFDFYVRVPGWADQSQSTTTVTSTGPGAGGGNASAVTVTVAPDAESGLHLVGTMPKGTTTVSYQLSTSIRVEDRANGSVAVYHGALLYGLSIESANSSSAPYDYTTNAPMAAGYAPVEARDWTMVNTSAWNYAVDPSTLAYRYSGEAGQRQSLANPIWAPGAPPNYMTAQACLIDWPLYVGSVPGRVPLEEDRACVGDAVEVELRPYGSTKLHMVDLPTVDLSTVPEKSGSSSRSSSRSSSGSSSGSQIHIG